MSLPEVPWKSRDGLMVFIVAWIGAPILFVLALRLFSGVPLIYQFREAFARGDIMANFTFAVADALAALAMVGFYLRKYEATLDALGFRRFSLAKTLLYLVLAFVGFAILVAIAYTVISLLFPHFNPDQAQTNEFTQAATTPGARRLSFIALVLIPPIIEEVIFRGFIFPAFSKRYGVIFGAITSSLLFGVAHLQYNVGVYTVVLGLLLCLLYYKLRSIVPGIVLHMLNNYLAFIAITTK